ISTLLRWGKVDSEINQRDSFGYKRGEKTLAILSSKLAWQPVSNSRPQNREIICKPLNKVVAVEDGRWVLETRDGAQHRKKLWLILRLDVGQALRMILLQEVRGHMPSGNFVIIKSELRIMDLAPNHLIR